MSNQSFELSLSVFFLNLSLSDLSQNYAYLSSPWVTSVWPMSQLSSSVFSLMYLYLIYVTVIFFCLLLNLPLSDLCHSYLYLSSPWLTSVWNFSPRPSVVMFKILDTLRYMHDCLWMSFLYNIWINLRHKIFLRKCTTMKHDLLPGIKNL